MNGSGSHGKGPRRLNIIGIAPEGEDAKDPPLDS